MGRYSEGEVCFLCGNRGIVDVRKEGGTIDVAILTAILMLNLPRKNSIRVETHTSLTHSIPSSSGCANTSSRSLFAIVNHGASGSLSMKQDFALASVLVAVLHMFLSATSSLVLEGLKP